MPFACIAVALLALIWLTYLTIVQLFSVTRRDPISSLPVPPRKVQGNGAWPVLGHTTLFEKTGGDMALLFPPEWRIWKCNPWSKQIGDCFSVFIWGQWRVVVKGPEKTQKVIEETELDQGWAWSAPITLLGQHCLALLDDEDEAGSLRRMIEGPLNQDWVVKQAPQFAEMAQKCLDEIVNGKFSGGEGNGRGMNDSGHGGGGRPETATKKDKGAHGGDDRTMIQRCDSSVSDGGDSKMFHKIKWDALRSYTFDLIDGPVLHLEMFHESRLSSASTPSFRADRNDDSSGHTVRFNSTPIDEETPEEGSRNRRKKSKASRDMMMLWMERLKGGLTEVKFTLGKEWMQCWRCNWYGRAVNARDHLEAIVGAHVEKRDKLVPVHHEQGHSIRDPFANTLPLIAFTQDAFRPREDVMGRRRNFQSVIRTRAHSEADATDIPHPDSDEGSGPESPVCSQRARAASEPNYVGDQRRDLDRLCEKPSSARGKKNKKKKPTSILDHMLRQEDSEGMGITRAATTEISLLLWMMMEAGQAWTAMALNLLSMDEDAGRAVQEEVDNLEKQYGKDRLFTSFVLGKMDKIDALIYEAVRLCPQFFGGMKVVKQTVEVGGFQIPKNTNVIFCNPTEDKFDLESAMGKRPEAMGMNYPSVELHGFLALQGLEIPLMVLQTKVFLIVLLQNYTPFLSTKRTFIRRVQSAFHKQFTRKVDNQSKSSNACERSFDLECGLGGGYSAPPSPPSTPKRGGSINRDCNDLPPGTKDDEPEESLAMKLFTGIPFPEPRRVINIRPREKFTTPTTSPRK